MATATAARASTSAASASAAAELAAASRRRRRQRSRRAGGEGPQREAETPLQEGRTPLPRGPDTRNRTSNPDSWVLPGRTTTGGEARSTRARPPHPMGSQGKLRPSGQPREGSQTAVRGRRGSLLTRRLWRKSCRLRVRPLLWCSRSRGRPFSHALADRWARTPGSQMRPGRMLQGTG